MATSRRWAAPSIRSASPRSTAPRLTSPPRLSNIWTAPTTIGGAFRRRYGTSSSPQGEGDRLPLHPVRAIGEADRSEGGPHENHRRQQGLFVLVAARLAR